MNDIVNVSLKCFDDLVNEFHILANFQIVEKTQHHIFPSPEIPAIIGIIRMVLEQLDKQKPVLYIQMLILLQKAGVPYRLLFGQEIPAFSGCNFDYFRCRVCPALIS